MTPTIDELDKKARKLAAGALGDGEELVAVIRGRAKQAMIVTDQRIVMVKPGLLAGTWLGPKVAAFPLTEITAVNTHSGRGIGALELVTAGHPREAKADLTAAFQSPRWLPCHPSVSGSPLIGELRAYIDSDGRSRSARAELGAFDGRIGGGTDVG
jgi:Bacterial PH domain